MEHQQTRPRGLAAGALAATLLLMGALADAQAPPEPWSYLGLYYQGAVDVFGLVYGVGYRF